MKLRNINPLGQVDLPLIGRQGDPIGEPGQGCLEPGEEFDTTADQARQLLAQPTNYEPADDEARQLLDQLAAEALAEAEAALADAQQSADPQPATPAAGQIAGDGSGTPEPPAGTSNEGTA